MENKLKKLKDVVSEYTHFPDPYIQSLARSYELRQNLIINVIKNIDFPEKSHGLDIGCGIGLPACMTAILRPDLKITCMDISENILNVANSITSKVGLDKIITFEQENALKPKFLDESFDWIFSMDCINYSPQLGIEALQQCKRMLKKHGKIALLAWSSQQLLPGFPMLEAKLNATKTGIAPFNEKMSPDKHFLKTGKLLVEMGFEQIKPQSFIQNLCAPLSNRQILAMRDLVEMRWTVYSDNINDEEKTIFKIIMDENSTHYIWADPYYYGFFSYTLFLAQKGNSNII